MKYMDENLCTSIYKLRIVESGERKLAGICSDSNNLKTGNGMQSIRKRL